MIRRHTEESDEPPDPFIEEQRKLAELCCDYIMQFLVFVHPIIEEPYHTIYDNELLRITNLSDKIWALTDDPPDLFLLALGVVCHRAGRYDEAAHYLEKSQNLEFRR